MTDNKLTAYQRQQLTNQTRIAKALERIADALAPEEEAKTGNSVNGIPRFSQGGTVFPPPGGASPFGAGAVSVQMDPPPLPLNQAGLRSVVEPMTEFDR